MTMIGLCWVALLQTRDQSRTSVALVSEVTFGFGFISIVIIACVVTVTFCVLNLGILK